MKNVRMAVLSLMLVSPAAFADDVTIGWSGDIIDYAATPGSGAPLALTNDEVTGRVTYNTNFFPPPDTGTGSGILSYSGSNLFRSTLWWQGGAFKSGFGRGVDSQNILLNTVTDELTLTDDHSYTDSKGNQHQAQFVLDLTGFGSPTSSGSGNFLNVTSAAGYAADFEVDKVRVKTVSAPEIDPGSALSAMSLLAGALAVIRGRRRKA